MWSGISRDVVQKYFENIKKELPGVPPSNLYNYDETNLTDRFGQKRLSIDEEQGTLSRFGIPRNLPSL